MNTTQYDIKKSVLYKRLLEGKKLQLRAKQVLQTTDYREALVLLDKGYIKRYKINNDGTESIQGIYGPGDILPISWMLKVLMGLHVYSGPETFYYETMTNIVLYTVRQDQFLELKEQDPDFYQTIAYIAGVRLETYIHNFENISLHSTEKRLAHQILFHARHFGSKGSKGIKISLPLTQKDLASILDVARETVSVNLKTLREQNLITTNKYIVVKDANALEEFAYS